MRCPLLLLVVHRSTNLAALLALEVMIVVVDLLELVTQSLLEVLEGEHHHSDIVESLVGHTCLHHLLHDVTAYLVDGLVLAVKVLLGCNPCLLYDFGIADLVKYSVAAQKKEVHAVVDGEFFDVWSRNHNIRVASEFLTLGFDVSKGPGNRESTWEDSERSIDDIWIFFTAFSLLKDSAVVLARLVCDGLYLLVRISSSYCLCLIDSTSVGKDSLLFTIVVGLVIDRQIDAEVATVGAHDGSAVSNVHDVDLLFDQERHYGTGAAAVQHMLPSLSKRLHGVEEVDFCLFVAVNDSLSWVRRELSILDDELMQIISEKVSACISTMSIKYTKEAALWPVFDVLLGGRLHDIEHDADSVLVVVSDDSLVRIRSVPNYAAILSNTAFGWLPAWKIQGCRIWRWPVAQQKRLDI